MQSRFGAGLHKVDGAATESAAGHPTGYDAGHRDGDLDHGVQLRRADLEQVAHGGVGGREQPSERLEIATSERRNRCHDPRVLGDDVLAAPPDDLRQPVAIARQHGLVDIAQ